jgi:formate-dependent phosphoribosylglycinamide formyltransferase (GAR transformylase)
MKLLVLTSEPVDGDVLRAAIGDDAVRDAEVLVVSPALHRSKLRYWVSDDDRAIAHAEAVQEETAERLEEEGIDAVPAAQAGDVEPLQALDDALATYPADRVIVVTHPEGDRDYREEELDEASERLGVPVSLWRVTR